MIRREAKLLPAAVDVHRRAAGLWILRQLFRPEAVDRFLCASQDPLDRRCFSAAGAAADNNVHFNSSGMSFAWSTSTAILRISGR